MHAHEHERLSADRRALGAALALIAGFMVVEVVAGLLSDSLAVLADAGHMLSDSASLALALFAAWLAGRPATSQRSFGYRRAEILAALANGVLLVVVAIWIFVEAARRLSDPPIVKGGWVLVVGAIGVVMLVLLVPLLRRPSTSRPRRPLRPLPRALLFFAIGAFGGAFQAGVGILLLYALSAGGADLVRGNAVKVVLNFCFSLLVLPIFVSAQQVALSEALVLGTGFAAGGLIGPRIAVRGGERVIRPVLVCAVVALAGRMLGLY